MCVCVCVCACVCVRVCVCGGGGGGRGNAHLKNQDQIINVGMIRQASCEDTRAKCQTYGLTEIGATCNGAGNLLRASRGLCPSPPPPPPPHPRKCSNLKSLKRNFQHSRADSCVKKVSKIDRLSS